MTKSETIDKLLTSLKKAQSEFPAIPKNGYNPHFKSKYTLLDDVIAICSPVLHKNDLLVTQTTAIDPMLNNRLITTLFHTSGQFIQSEITLINKAGTDQGIGSSISYCRRYSWIAMLGLSDNDDDANETIIKPKMHSEPIMNHVKPLAEKAAKMAGFVVDSKMIDLQQKELRESISPKQIDQLREVREQAKLSQDQVKALMKENFKKEDPRELEKGQLDSLISMIKKRVNTESKGTQK